MNRQTGGYELIGGDTKPAPNLLLIAPIDYNRLRATPAVAHIWSQSNEILRFEEDMGWKVGVTCNVPVSIVTEPYFVLSKQTTTELFAIASIAISHPFPYTAIRDSRVFHQGDSQQSCVMKNNSGFA